MNKRNKQIIFSILIILTELIGLYFQIYPNKWYCFTYYTVLSNLYILIFFSLNLYFLLRKKERILNNASYLRIKAGASAAILMTFFVFCLLLLPRQTKEEFFTIKNFALHFIAPILSLVDWYLFDESGKYRRLEPFFFTLLPFAYLIYSLIKAIVFNISIPDNKESPFPYFFLNIYKLGVAKVALYCIMILVIFIFLSFIMCLIKKKKTF